MATWYRTNRWHRTEIEAVEVVKETESMVTLAPDAYHKKGRALRKHTSFEHLWRSREEAREHLLECERRRARAAEEELQGAVANVVILERMGNPGGE